MTPANRTLITALNLASRRLHKYVEDAEYFATTYDAIYAARWQRGAWRRKAKITIAFNRAAKLARALDRPALIVAVAESRCLAKSAVRACDGFFPVGADAREWTGANTLQQFDAQIDRAKCLLKGLKV